MKPTPYQLDLTKLHNLIESGEIIPDIEFVVAAAQRQTDVGQNDAETLREEIRNLVLVFSLTDQDRAERRGAEKMREVILSLPILAQRQTDTGKEGK